MKKTTSEALTRQQKAEIELLADLPDEEIDTSDIPEVLDWSGAIPDAASGRYSHGVPRAQKSMATPRSAHPAAVGGQ